MSSIFYFLLSLEEAQTLGFPFKDQNELTKEESERGKRLGNSSQNSNQGALIAIDSIFIGIYAVTAIALCY